MDPSQPPPFAPEILTPREIRELRLRCHLTQQQLARKLNVSRETIVRWERGKQVPNPVYVELLRNVEREALRLDESPSTTTAFDDRTISDVTLRGKCPICGKRVLRSLRLQYALSATEEVTQASGGILGYQCVRKHVFFVMAKDVKGT